ncbi:MULTISPECIES: tape measure protein [Enterobacter]|uniref:tape measure protein n=1 Tax=Enterobacter TaxID=547 RepID=UPI0015F495B5|nr:MULTISPECIES: tape measure protein [Enterobacter]MBA7773684.1 tape measure protein [Enterobacter sp. RHBSTW-00974]MBA7778847.1 tape measure protein [Enterobacter sp. RHBSTW-00318]MBA7831450.1 tape measure protein [Enterobacter sp. RHBSTW-00340]WGG63905.1 tape measure protein [Enterobacter ludwigii]
MAENVGNIYYEIDMDVRGMLSAQQQVNRRLDSLESGFDSTTRAVAGTESSMSGLSKVALALATALSAQQIGEYADAWANVSNKLANSLRPNEQLIDVTERVFNITQQTRSSLEATASLYSRLERATRQYGTSADDLARLTTIINQGFVVSGASAQEAENAIIQLSQGLASGALRGDEFNSVNENGNRLMVALADSMGVTIGQMRQLAADGKLTTEVIVNGLLSQGATIGAEFAKTTATISQSMQIAGNNITKFFGENATVKSGVAVFNEAIITASENISLLSTVLTGVAAVMGSRFVGALTMSAAAQVQSTFAAQRQASANSQVAQTALVAATSAQRKALADKEAALSAMALAQAEYNVARGSAAEMLAMDALIAAKSRATAASITLAQAETAQAAASARAATAARAASAAIGLARGALALIGGPAGAAMLAAGAIFYFWQKAQQAKEEAIAFADGLDKLNASMTSMSNTQLRGTIADANNSIRAQKEAVADLQSEVDSLRDRYQNFTPAAQEVAESMGQGADFARQQAEVSDELARKTRDLEAAKDKLSRTEETASEATRTLTNNMLTAMGVHDQLIEKSWSLEQVQGAVAKAFGDTADEINRANQAGKNFDPKALQISPATKEGDKLILNLEEQNELLKIQDERQRAVVKAQMQAAKVTDNKNQISSAGKLAGENYDLQKAEEARKKTQRESEQQDKRSATSADSVAQKLANLKQQAELAAGSTQELSREQAMLNAEQSLGKGATQAQIAEARQYAAAKWDTANAIKAESAAQKLLPESRENATYKQDVEALNTALAAKKISQEQYNATSEQLEQQHQVNLAKIRAQKIANVTPVQDAQGGIDSVQQLANQHATELAMIQQFESDKGKLTQRGIELANAANTQYEHQRIAAQWEIWKNQNSANELLAAGFDSLAGNASNAFTGILTGSMSAQEAMQSLASNALNSLINGFVQMGVEWVKSAITGSTAQIAATTATTSAAVAGTATTTAASVSSAAATTAAWTPAAIVASIGSFGGAAAIGIGAVIAAMAMAGGIAGKRKNGGPVSAGSMYQVGEGGMPEIYQASNGSQYMIPGDNGKVISNKELTNGGGGGVVVNINNYTSSNVDAQATPDGNGGWTVDAFVYDLDNGGPASQAIQRNHQAPRKARS